MTSRLPNFSFCTIAPSTSAWCNNFNLSIWFASAPIQHFPLPLHRETPQRIPFVSEHPIYSTNTPPLYRKFYSYAHSLNGQNPRSTLPSTLDQYAFWVNISRPKPSPKSASCGLWLLAVRSVLKIEVLTQTILTLQPTGSNCWRCYSSVICTTSKPPRPQRVNRYRSHAGGRRCTWVLSNG